MCDRCDALQDEVDYLRERLGEQINRDLLRVLMKSFDFSQGEAGVVAALYQARGALTNAWQIADAIHTDHARTYDGNVVQVHIMRIRRKTDSNFIVTFMRVGYALSDEARLKIAEAIRLDTVAETLKIDDPIKIGVQWDAKRIGELARLRFGEKLSFSECGRRMKLSRNACISAANRYLRQEGEKAFA